MYHPDQIRVQTNHMLLENGAKQRLSANNWRCTEDGRVKTHRKHTEKACIIVNFTCDNYIADASFEEQ